MLSRAEFEQALDQHMTKEAATFLESVPYASHLTDPEQELNDAYYIRHRIETVKRIRLTSKADALALAAMIDEDYEASRPWSRYVAEELDHDSLFLSDLAEHGYSEADVATVEPFASTVALIDYLLAETTKLGALPAVADAVFIEWNSERYSQAVVDKAENVYSSAHVLGSKAHCGIDESEDHYGMLIDVAYRLVARRNAEAEFFALISRIAELLRAYFRELFDETVTEVASAG
jgi:hypothetical protein